MFTQHIVGRLVGSVDSCPWGAATGRHVAARQVGSWSLPPGRPDSRSLYTPDERRRRDATPWTMVQGVLAPVQFLVFAISLCLVLRFLLTGQGEQAATVSVVAKTCVLYTIMVTGAIWEREVFGQYLFAPAFFWEDSVSMLVIGLHTAYLAALMSGSLDSQGLMLLALVAYATYVVNAAQFVMKLRAARMAEKQGWDGSAHGLGHA